MAVFREETLFAVAVCYEAFRQALQLELHFNNQPVRLYKVFVEEMACQLQRFLVVQRNLILGF